MAYASQGRELSDERSLTNIVRSPNICAMTNKAYQRQQAAAGLEQLATLARAQSWRTDGTPSLPPTQAAILRMLPQQAQGLRARHIAERLGISAASLSDSLRALESKQWIERLADPQDGRATLVRLTAPGRRLARKLNDPSQGIGALLEDLGEADLGALLRVTQLLVHQAQQQGLASGVRSCLGCRYFQPNASGQKDKPHICGFLQQAFGDPELRTDCAEQEPAGSPHLAASVLRFCQTHPH